MTRQFETTEVGSQSLIDGVRPVSLGEKLTARTAHPMTPKRNPHAGQKCIVFPFCDHGFFDGAGQVRAPVERSPPNAVRKLTC
ncbi:hypothetical protein [Fretibacter rubidus]|uniref:hypothetical protein n=1 Tax=Fretibacter rubidus TaxID=570162 RepID=UPI003529D746